MSSTSLTSLASRVARGVGLLALVAGVIGGCGDEPGGGGGMADPTCDDRAFNGDETGIDCGGPTCPRCGVGGGCASADDCQAGLVCEDGECADAPTCDDGFRNGDETGVDCGGSVCGPCEDGSRCDGAADCDSGRCVEGTCVSCSDGVTNADETDTDCGGSVCGPCEEGARCAVDADCLTMACDFRCVACDDGVQNAAETDVDCGGPVCPGCQDAAMCVENEDCASMQCEEAACISCMDGVQNGTELGIDCGGGLCPGCADGATCVEDTDCASEICEEGTCISCADGIQNGRETDLDCGGADCPGCLEGGACVEDMDCSGGPCVDAACTVDCDPFGVGASTDYTACSYAATAPPCPDISATGTLVTLLDDDNERVSLPFEFDYFGTGVELVWIESNGVLAFLAPADPIDFENACIPALPVDGAETFIAVFWDDLDPSRTITGETSAIYHETLGTSPDRRFAVQWTVPTFDFLGTSTSSGVDVRAVLYETSNRIELCYVDTDTDDASDCADVDDCHADGVSATAGIQGTRTVAVQYSCDTASLVDGLVLRFDPT